jgi:hypothetical protein
MVFISHSARDHSQASTIAATLRTLGCRTWLDTDHIPPGTHVDLSIQAGLDSSTILLVLIGSPCRTCMAEWIYVLDHRPQIPVIPLILPNSSGRIPWRLSPYRRLTSSDPKSLSRLCHPPASLQ